MSEAQHLVEQASHGDPIAVQALLERYLPGLRAFIRLRVGEVIREKESTSDLAQSVCLEVLAHMDRFQYRGEVGFKNWLFTTALRKIANRYKYYGADKRDVAREVSAVTPPGSSGSAANLLECYHSFYTPSQDAMQREEVARIEGAFDQLPENYREVITLSRVVGLSRAEIAAELNTTEDTVRGLLSRALSRLSTILDRPTG
jgi:RNA polymerase sigma-70 factor (ECF subfamily)